MAAKKKKKVSHRAKRTFPGATDELMLAQFLSEMLDGTIKPLALYISRNARGRLVIEFDEEDNT